MKKVELYLFLLFASFVAVSGVSNTIEAQTRFERPDTVPTYSKYGHIEECLVALDREYESYIKSAKFWKDTAVYDPKIVFKPYPPEQLMLGKGCFDRFAIDSIINIENNVYKWARSLLRAGRIDDAWKLQMRTLVEAPDSAKHDAFLSMYFNFIDSRPIQVEKLLQLYELGRKTVPEDSLVRRFFLASMYGGIGMKIDDSQMISESLDSVIAVYSRFSDEQKNAWANTLHTAYTLSSLNKFADSIRAGPKANLSYQRGIHLTVYGDSKPFDSSFIEIPMPEINAEYWFYKPYVGKDRNLLKKMDRPHKIPSIGKVSVVSFVNGCNNFRPVDIGRKPGGENCVEVLSVLARLQKKFPQVEFTTVTQTYGFVGASAMLTPGDEADSLSKQYMNRWGLGGFFAVGVTEFMRIPGLDNRRIDNEPKYQADLKNVHRSLGSRTLLIDRKGRIVTTIALNAQYEQTAINFIQAVIDRKDE